MASLRPHEDPAYLPVVRPDHVRDWWRAEHYWLRGLLPDFLRDLADFSSGCTRLVGVENRRSDDQSTFPGLRRVQDIPAHRQPADMIPCRQVAAYKSIKKA